MLKSLNQWRAECSPEQLHAFDDVLAPLCAAAIGSRLNLNTRYHGSYHRALVNKRVMRQAVQTQEYISIPGDAPWWRRTEVDAGIEFCTVLADHDGALKIERVASQYLKSVSRLLLRGVVFERDGQYHLPAELVVEYRSKEHATSWLTLVAGMPLPILRQLTPESAKETMLKPTPTRNELGAWLAVSGALARTSDVVEQLNEEDWALLLALRSHAIDSFHALQQYYPELEPVHIVTGYYSRARQGISLRKTLEKSIPEALRKLARLGLIGIAVRHGDDGYASIILCDEASALLTPHMGRMRQRMANRIQQNWQADACDAEQPSPWGMDALLWRLWVALHFLPLGVTKQGSPRKNDLKRIGRAIHIEDGDLIGLLILSLVASGLATLAESRVSPASIHWSTWRKTMRNAVLAILRRQTGRWRKAEQARICAVLAELPVSQWLHLDKVLQWLQLRAEDDIAQAAWEALFFGYQHLALYHVDTRRRRVFFLPQFRAVVEDQPLPFPAPGWRGADKQAKTYGFVSASREIQLPPDCNHAVLKKLAGFCTLTKVEQMITLQLDDKALLRMATDKSALKRSQGVLQSLQSPLPQAVRYLFDKHQARKPVAAAAATSLVLVLREPSALHQLHKTGFAFSQPFADRPEIVLLDASADAHAFVKHCADAAILLDTVISPLSWISGTAAIKAWMEAGSAGRRPWLEIAYQKTRSSKPKQVIARLVGRHSTAMCIHAMRKTKSGYTAMETYVTLEPKHILRLRELGAAEVQQLGLDALL